MRYFYYIINILNIKSKMENKNFVLFIFLINLISFIRLSGTSNDPYGYIIINCNSACQCNQNDENNFSCNVTESSVSENYKLEIHFKNIDPNYQIIFKNFINSPDKIIFIDFSNFNTSLLTNMSYMFSGLESLKSIDLTYLDLSSVTDMESMLMS